jgi:hypothetical protein
VVQFDDKRKTLPRLEIYVKTSRNVRRPQGLVDR